MALLIANDPFPDFDKWADGESVKWVDQLNGWMVVGREDVASIAADLKRFSVEKGYRGVKGEFWKKVLDKPAGKLSSRFLRYTDPPVWDKFRWLHEAGLPYKSLSGPDSKPQSFKELVESFVIPHLEKSKGKLSIEGMQEWCQPLPCLASMAVLGLPFEDFEKLRDWTLDGILMLVRNTFDHEFWSDEAAVKANHAAEKLTGYLEDLFAKRKEDPKNDFISRIITFNEKQKADDKAQDYELLQVVANQLMGGFHESSMSVLADGLYLLLSTDQYKDIVKDPSLVPSAVEEILRFHPTAPIAPRKANETVEIGGKTIKEDDYVFLDFGAAQRDPNTFDNARVFDIHRKGDANGNLSFGAGPHRCPGQPQMRMLANVFFEQVPKMFPNLRLQEWPENHYMELRYQPRMDIVLLESLPLAL